MDESWRNHVVNVAVCKEGEIDGVLSELLSMSRRGDVMSSDRKWTHIRKVRTLQDSIFRGEYFV